MGAFLEEMISLRLHLLGLARKSANGRAVRSREGAMGRRTAQDRDDETPVAGGGLLDRRALLKAVGLLGTSMASAGLADSSLRSNPDRPTSMRAPGRPMSGYGSPLSTKPTSSVT